MGTGPQNKRADVLHWVRRVTDSLDEQNRLDAIDYQRLSPDERWRLVTLACRGVVDRLDDRQRANAEVEAEADARRFGALMREIQERLRE